MHGTVEKAETYQAQHADFRVLLQKHSEGWFLEVFKGQLSAPVEALTIPGDNLEEAEAQANAIVNELARLEPFSGETEQGLAEAARGAEYEKIILFFDEGDALFGKRTEGQTQDRESR